MRLKLLLQKTSNAPVSIKYCAEIARDVAAWLYAIIAQSNETYSKKLHDEGILIPMGKNGKIIKPFCFSLIGQTEKGAILNLASPDPKFLHHFTQGKKKGVPILHTRADKNTYVLHSVKQEALPDLTYLEESDLYVIHCYTLAPIVIRGDGGKYLSTRDTGIDLINSSLMKNLTDKYAAVYGTPLKDPYISVKFGPHRITELSMYDDSGQPNTIIGHMGEVTLIGSIEMIMTALYNGLGAKNAMGCGFLIGYDHRFNKKGDR